MFYVLKVLNVLVLRNPNSPISLQRYNKKCTYARKREIICKKKIDFIYLIRYSALAQARSASHPINAPCPIIAPDGMLMLFNSLQLANAYPPIYFIVFGRVTEVRLRRHVNYGFITGLYTIFTMLLL